MILYQLYVNNYNFLQQFRRTIYVRLSNGPHAVPTLSDVVKIRIKHLNKTRQKVVSESFPVIVPIRKKMTNLQKKWVFQYAMNDFFNF